MNTTLFSRLRTALLGLAASALLLNLTACDATNTARDADVLNDDLAATTDAVLNDLDLPDASADAVRASLAAHEDQRNEPGFLWHVAADLQANLSADQKANLFERAEARRAERLEGDGRRGAKGFRGSRRGGDFGRGAMADLNLTDEQKAAMQEIHEMYRPQLQALMQARRDGELTREEARSQMQDLRETMRAAMDEILTDEQKALVEEHRAERQERRADRQKKGADRRAFRDDAKAVMVDVLGLTEAQQEALQALRTEQREQMKTQMRAARAEGDLDREALRDAMQALRAEHEAALADLLTVEQFETMKIHRVLSARMLRHKAGERFGRRQG